MKHTPDAHSAPAFPYTIACTFTAVPLRCVTRLMRRYVTARSLFQDANTASVAMRSCVVGSSGNAAPRASYAALYSATSSRRSATSRSTSDSRFLRFFMFASLASNRRAARRARRRRTCRAGGGRRLAENARRRGRRRRRRGRESFKPRFNTVSIIPGIGRRALHATSRGTACGLPAAPGAAKRPECPPARVFLDEDAPAHLIPTERNASSTCVGAGVGVGVECFWAVQLAHLGGHREPGGTFGPRRDISARPAPLPPSRSFMVRSPSAVRRRNGTYLDSGLFLCLAGHLRPSGEANTCPAPTSVARWTELTSRIGRGGTRAGEASTGVADWAMVCPRECTGGRRRVCLRSFAFVSSDIREFREDECWRRGDESHDRTARRVLLHARGPPHDVRGSVRFVHRRRFSRRGDARRRASSSASAGTHRPNESLGW